MRKSNKKGFTIVELVIVIAVIAILAGVLIPVFSGVVKKARISADTQVARNLNTSLAADEAINGEIDAIQSQLVGIEAGEGKVKAAIDAALQAAKDYNIDLSKSWMIGDGENDIKAGIAAGCKTGLLGEEQYGQNETACSLLDILKSII